MNVNVTNHGEQRVKDRIGISKKSASKVSEKALIEGITHKEAKGQLKKYFDYLFLSHGVANNIRIYNQKAFVFKGKTLITILNVPSRYHKLINNINKSKN